MRVFVHVLEPFHAQVSINLGRGQSNMTKQLLHGPKISPSLNQVRGKSMTHRVW